MILTGGENSEIFRENPFPVSLGRPQIPYGLTPDRGQSESNIKANHFMTYTQIIAVCSENHAYFQRFCSVLLHRCSVLSFSSHRTRQLYRIESPHLPGTARHNYRASGNYEKKNTAITTVLQRFRTPCVVAKICAFF